MSRESLLVHTLVELADSLVDDFDVIDVLTKLSDRCVGTLDVTAAGVMLASPAGVLQIVASSSEAMRLLEVFQLQSDEGPCIDCFRSGRPVVNVELSTIDGRWPSFTPLALSRGFASVHCLPMRLRGRTIGALNLFRSESGSLEDGDVLVAQGLADVATIAILQHQAALSAATLNDQLNAALHSRVMIEQAKGKIAEASHVDMDVAFERLRHHARNHNLGLSDLARSVADGSLPIARLDPLGSRTRQR
jgi:GAF domain-containing protein